MQPPTSIANLWEMVPEPIKKIYTELSSQWKACEQRFQVWTDNALAPEQALKANKLFSALPVIGLTVILPWKISASILTVGYLVNIAFPIDRDLYNTALNGVGVGAGLLALSSAFEFLLSFNPLELLAALVYGSISATLLPKGDLL
jgi:hypothetical protein